MIIADQRVVAIRYIMRNSSGEELENNMHDSPIYYLHGSGNILPALESGLTGLQPGDRKSLSVSGDMVTGLQDEYHFEIVVDEVRKATEVELQRGRVIQEFPDDACGPECDCR